MTIRKRIIFFVAVSFALSIAVILSQSRSFLMSTSRGLERLHAEQSVEQACKALGSEVDMFGKAAEDWAYWDDTYAFIAGENPDYVTANLPDESFSRTGMSWIVITDVAGKFLCAKAFDLIHDTPMAVSPEMESDLLRLLERLKTPGQAAVRGIAFIGGAPTIVQGCRVTKTSDANVWNGFLLMGRLVGPKTLDRMNFSDRYKIAVERFDGRGVTKDFQDIQFNWRDGAATITRIKDDDWVCGYQVLKDVYGKPALIVQLSVPRDFSANSRDMMNMLIVTVLGISLVSCVLLSILLERFVTSPLAHLATFVGNVRATRNISQRIVIHAKGELLELADALNSMLAELERDGTERRRAEAALVASERRFHDLLMNMHLAAVIVDMEGRIIFCNQFWADLTERTREKLIGTLFTASLAEEDRAPFRQLFRGESHSDLIPHLEADVLVRKSGWRRVVWDNVYLNDSAGHVTGTALIGRDVSYQQQLEEELRHSQKMQAIGQLAGGVAHDFNNLLSVILGYATSLRHHAGAGSPIAEAVANIETAASRGAELTRQLLGFARKGKNRETAVNVHDTISEVVRLLERTVDKSIRFVHHFEASVPWVLGDPGQIEQALLNLTVNARDAMPQGGEICFRTRDVALSSSLSHPFPDVRPGNYVKITVSDTGCGIAPDNLKRIFEPFFTTKEQGKGTGLGLATVYGIVENHGGSIRVESEVGHGTRFEILFPVTTPPTFEESETPEEPVAAATSVSRILIVDDEALLRELLCEVLAELGYEVATAVNGEDAVQYYAEKGASIDLVILDFIMPVMNGYECFQRLKEINPNVRAILSTGYGLDNKIQEIMDDGVIALLEKPYTMERVASVVAQVLREGSVTVS